jgi:NAD dependent epimerase/dehydratase family
VVLASAGGALIGDATPPVTERSLPRPISPYGASKLAGEGYAHAFAKTYGVRAVAIRFGCVYGPWCARKTGALNVFFESIHSGVPLVIYGDANERADLCRQAAGVPDHPIEYRPRRAGEADARLRAVGHPRGRDPPDLGMVPAGSVPRLTALQLSTLADPHDGRPGS